MDKIYTILPFQFRRFGDRLLLTNMVGEFCFLSQNTFNKLTKNELGEKEQQLLSELLSKHFIAYSNLDKVIDMLAIKYRTKKAFLRNSTVLHMMVVTVRCNHKCKYCHASSEDEVQRNCDMSIATARQCVDTIFQSPSPAIKIEFQGGEPLLNYSAIVETIKYAEVLNKKHKKHLEFVLCTNLTLLDDEKLNFLKKHNVLLSISLDGPQHLHDSCRVLRNGKSSYDDLIKSINLARSVYGECGISALMTTTRNNLFHLKDVVDEYVKQGFHSIFLRSLNPFGFAKDDENEIGYSTEQFVDEYKKALKYIIDINVNGLFFVEQFASILLARILTPFATGFMDLQFPSGTGLCGVIYDYNGNVYPSDEGRMLARKNNTTFLMGNVSTHSFPQLFNCKIMRELINKSCPEVMPLCSDCTYQHYCGADPIRNYSEQGDIMGFRPMNSFCKKHMAMFDCLMEYIHNNDSKVMDVFWSWITNTPLKQPRRET